MIVSLTTRNFNRLSVSIFLSLLLPFALSFFISSSYYLSLSLSFSCSLFLILIFLSLPLYCPSPSQPPSHFLSVSLITSLSFPPSPSPSSSPSLILSLSLSFCYPFSLSLSIQLYVNNAIMLDTTSMYPVIYQAVNPSQHEPNGFDLLLPEYYTLSTIHNSYIRLDWQIPCVCSKCLACSFAMNKSFP